MRGVDRRSVDGRDDSAEIGGDARATGQTTGPSIQAAALAGNSGKNSGFRQTSRARGRFIYGNDRYFNGFAEIDAPRGTAEKFAGTAGFSRGKQKPVHDAPFGPPIPDQFLTPTLEPVNAVVPDNLGSKADRSLSIDVVSDKTIRTSKGGYEG
jgi:hypothetical protein